MATSDDTGAPAPTQLNPKIKNPKLEYEKVTDHLEEATRANYASRVLCKLHYQMLIDDDCDTGESDSVEIDRRLRSNWYKGGLETGIELIHEHQSSLLESVQKYLEERGYE